MLIEISWIHKEVESKTDKQQRAERQSERKAIRMSDTIPDLCGNAAGPYCADRLCRECDECGATPSRP